MKAMQIPQPMRGVVLVLLCCILLSFGLAAGNAFGAETDAAKVDAVKPDTVKPTAAAPLAYVAVAGAPGDGEPALTAALTKRLSGIGVKPGSAQASDVYSVEGTVRVTAAKDGRESVRIDWTVFAPDGSTLGGVSQTRVVRKGSLDKKWGAAADAAARAAASEISKLIPH
jgi:hypothetical protein